MVCATSKASDQPAYAQSDQSHCKSLKYSMTVNLLTKLPLELLTGGCTGSSESTLVKMPHCWQSRHGSYHDDCVITRCVIKELHSTSGPYDCFFFIYSKTCHKWPLKKKTKIVFQDQLSLNASQKHCRMLHGEHSAILSTFIKLPLISIKTFVLSNLEWPLKTGFTVQGKSL